MIFSVENVRAATDAELLDTYQTLTGLLWARGFDSRAVAERRVIDALMASADAAGHLGVSKGQRGQPCAFIELVRRAYETGRGDAVEMVRAVRAMAPPGVVLGDPGTNPYLPGTVAARLWGGEALPQPQERVPRPAPAEPHPNPQPRAPKAPRAPGTAPRAKSIEWVRAIAGGTSTPRETSTRGQVLVRIRSFSGGVSVGQLTAEFGPPALGCVMKLIEVKHLEVVAPPQKGKS